MSFREPAFTIAKPLPRHFRLLMALSMSSLKPRESQKSEKKGVSRNMHKRRGGEGEKSKRE
jgi:hypothetical protein